MQVQSQVGNIPWRRAWQPTPVLLPGESVDRGAWQAVVHRVAKSGHSCSGFACARASPEAASAFPRCFCSAVTEHSWRFHALGAPWRVSLLTRPWVSPERAVKGS